MKRYGRIQGLVLALGSASFYRDVARNWDGIGLLYLLLLFALTWIPTLVRLHIDVGNFADKDFPKVVKDLPPITLQGGKVSSPVPQPFLINDPKTGKPVFVMDTTGKINSLEQSPAKLLLTQTEVHVQDRGKIQSRDLSPVPDVTITKEWLQELMGLIANWLAVGVFPVVIIGSLIRALVLMFIAALLGLMFSSDADLGFGALLRMAAVGMTLSVYMDTGMSLAYIHVPFVYWFLIATAITTAYVAFGARAVASEAPAQDPDEYGGLPGDPPAFRNS